MAPQDRAAQTGEREKRVRVPLELEGLGRLKHFHTLFNTFIFDILLIHNVNKEAVVISIHRKHTGSLPVGVDWHGAATDHRNKTVLG